MILANSQPQTFTAETRTAGYTVVNLKASYIIARRRAAHQFRRERVQHRRPGCIEITPLSSRTWAPEIGRGIRLYLSDSILLTSALSVNPRELRNSVLSEFAVSPRIQLARQGEPGFG